MTPTLRTSLRLLALLAAALPLLSVAAPSGKAARESSPLVWPAPPDTARIRWAGAFDRAKAAAPSFGERLRRLLTGGSTSSALRLVRPTDVYAEDSARVYVTDAAQASVFVMDRSGRTLRSLALPGATGPARPLGIGGDGRGHLYVTDPPGRRVVVMTRDGAFVRAFGGRGVLLNPVDVAVDTAANVAWVADSHLHQILAFDAQGRVVHRLGLQHGDANAKPVEAEDPKTAADRSIAEVHRAAAGSRDVRENRGGGEGEFLYPCGVAVAADGRLYVCDGLNARVQVFERDGRFVRSFGRLGDVPGAFARPKGIALDQSGNVYVVDAAFNNVQLFDAQGRLLLAFGQFGNGPGQLWLPLGLWVDRHDRIYVADRYNGRVQEFAKLGGGPSAGSASGNAAGARRTR